MEQVSEITYVAERIKVQAETVLQQRPVRLLRESISDMIQADMREQEERLKNKKAADADMEDMDDLYEQAVKR